MNIGINCFSINPNYGGGINTYTFGLLDGFIERGKDFNFQIYVSSRNRHLFKKFKSPENFRVFEFPDSTVRKLLRKLSFASLNSNFYRFASDKIYRDIIKEANSRSDIIYTPTTFLFPFKFQKPTIISMHDIQQFHYPEFFSKPELLNRKIHFSLSTKLTTYIQASSQFIKEDLLKHFNNLKEEQIVVINEGVKIEEFSSPKETEYLIKKFNIPDEFLFFPAQLWHHKNHITVLKALKIIEQESGLKIHTVLTGSKASAAKLIFDFINNNKMDYIHYLGLVPFSDLLALYKKAKFLITAVLYESSSLPILEAAASGTPVIASDTPPNIEMSSILNLNLFEAKNENKLADLLLKIWDNKDLIEKQVSNNNRNIIYYSWNNVAEKYLNFFKNI